MTTFDDVFTSIEQWARSLTVNGPDGGPALSRRRRRALETLLLEQLAHRNLGSAVRVAGRMREHVFPPLFIAPVWFNLCGPAGSDDDRLRRAIDCLTLFQALCRGAPFLDIGDFACRAPASALNTPEQLVTKAFDLFDFETSRNPDHPPPAVLRKNLVTGEFQMVPSYPRHFLVQLLNGPLDELLVPNPMKKKKKNKSV